MPPESPYQGEPLTSQQALDALRAKLRGQNPFDVIELEGEKRSDYVLVGGKEAPLPEPALVEPDLVPEPEPEPEIEPRGVEKFADGEVDAQRRRAERIRSDPALRTMLDIVRHDPDIWGEVSEVLRRKVELESKGSEPDQRHRAYTGLLTGIALSERGSTLLNMAIDRSVSAETEYFTDAIRTAEAEGEPAYVQEMVIGSGPHSAIYNSEKMAVDPNQRALTIEGKDRIGGQFAQAEGPVWYLNSRTRPESNDNENLPGTPGSLNTLKRGPLQQADLESRAYGSQDRLATAVRVDDVLSTRLMSGTSLTEVVKNPEYRPDEPGTGRYIATIKQSEGEDMHLATDRIILTTGLGESVTGLENAGRRTRDLLRKENESFKSTGTAQVMTFEQFVESVGDPHNSFPLQGFKNIAVVGPGDSGRVAIEYLLGYGPEARKSVANLDRVESVTWIGQDAMTKEDFEECERQRYASLGLEMPRQQDPNYYSRIKPVRGRALGLKKDGEDILIQTTTIQDDDGRAVFPNNIKTEAVDHVILAAGFTDKTNELFAGLVKETVTDPDIMFQRRAELLSSPGSVLKYADGKKFEITDRTFGYEFKVSLPSGKEINDDIDLGSEEETEAFLADIFGFGQPVELTVPDLRGRRENVRVNGKNVAQKFTGTEVYAVGAAAQLPLSFAEREKSPVLEKIPNNTAAIFRYADNTAALSQYLAQQTEPVPGDLASDTIQRPPVELETVKTVKKAADWVAVQSTVTQDEIAPLPTGVNSADVLRFAIGEISHSYVFPTDMPDIAIDFKRSSGEGADMPAFESATNVKMPKGGDSRWKVFMEEIVSSPAIANVMHKLSNPKNSTKGTVRLELGVKDGRIVLEAVNHKNI